MSFAEWQKSGWLRPHKTSRQEVAGLLAVVKRDLKASADSRIDADWRFAIAYNAALQSASLALKAAGYDVPKGGGAHHRTIESLKLTINDDGTIADLLQGFVPNAAAAFMRPPESPAKPKSPNSAPLPKNCTIAFWHG